MKSLKIFPLFLLALLLCSFTCEELPGRWVSGDISVPTSSPQEVMKMKCDYTFTAPDRVKVRYLVSYDISYDRKLKVNAYYEILVDGQYTCSPDSVVAIMDMSTAEIRISEDDVRITGIGLEDGLDQRQMQQQMVEMLEKSALMPLKASEASADVFSEISISGKKMHCLLNGDPIDFKRKK